MGIDHLRVLGLLFFYLTVSSSSTSACTCGRSAPAPCSSLKDAGAIFVGTVVDIENPPSENPRDDSSGVSRYRFRVDESIAGLKERELDVFSGRGGADCSYHFQRGEQYVVFPYQDDAGKLHVTVCSDTRPVSSAAVLLPQLRAMRDGRPFANLFGVLRRTQQPYGWVEDENYDRPLPNIAVELRSQNRSLATRTDENGKYAFYGVTAGTYQVWAALPAHLELAQTTLSDPLPPLEMPDSACFEYDINALPTGRIRGRVVGPDGEPLRAASVGLFRPHLYKESEMGWWEFQGYEGFFEFKNVAPGKYVLVFNNFNELKPDAPFLRTFYPGVTDFKSALQLDLQEGEQKLNADIHVTGGRPTRELIVRVQWPSEKLPEDIFLSVDASEGDVPYPQAESPGVFRLTLLRGAAYTIHAWQLCGLHTAGNTGSSIGSRQTERVVVDGSDDRTTEITLAFKSMECRP